MQVSSKLEAEGQQVAVILGNGKYDQKVLRAVAPKFNGKDINLAITSVPLPVKRGLSALEGLISLLDLEYRVEKALYLVDKEHVASIEEIKERLRFHGCDVESSKKSLNDKAAIFDFTRGSRRVKLYAAIAGTTKSIDEEMTCLARKVYGKQFELSEVKGINLRRLMRKVNKKTIRAALKGLGFILQSIEGESSRG